MTLDQVNVLSQQDAERELLRCCGSREWTRLMVAARPFESVAALYGEAERMWWTVGPADWLEAFGAHPKIGERTANSEWAAQEQAEVNSATASTVAGLVDANEQYFSKFGHIFIVCATGKSGEELLSILRTRLRNDPGHELRIAATEQSKIIRIRLNKLVTA